MVAWFLASLSVLVLSACGFLGIILVPIMKYKAYKPTLRFLVAIAAGTLSGDALMHLLPHALSRQVDAAKYKKSDFEQENMLKHGELIVNEDAKTTTLLCFCAFSAGLGMYILENFVPLLKGTGYGHAHGNVQHTQHPLEVEDEDEASKKKKKKSKKEEEEVVEVIETPRESRKNLWKSLSPIALMVVIGDCLHNMTDGLAIGAAFADSSINGFATSLAILFHELPHELGDFALLLQTGVTMKRAVFLNLISSILSFIGMAFGILIVHKSNHMVTWIYAGTAGSFLYIAFADLIPTMSIAHHPEDFRGICTTLLQILGVLSGGVIMLLIALNEHKLDDLLERL